MVPRRDTTTWNRDDRDLIVELRTSQANMERKIDSLEIGIKEINTGITARLLNLEGNAVNKIQFDQLETRVNILENNGIAQAASIRVWVILGGGVWSVFLVILSVVIAIKIH